MHGYIRIRFCAVALIWLRIICIGNYVGIIWVRICIGIICIGIYVGIWVWRWRHEGQTDASGSEGCTRQICVSMVADADRSLDR